ncbi:hypothetical protein PG996_004698 [Apiospora saccharicola]|uniref:Uncharacterized protein n=1 Tax=Apiospora saccharicola TaxID=335842 RepID=A0ABR1W8N8_9PEZI
MPWFDSYLQFPWRKPSNPAIKQEDNNMKQPIQSNRPSNSYQPPSSVKEKVAEGIKPQPPEFPTGMVPFSVSSTKLENEKSNLSAEERRQWEIEGLLIPLLCLH